MAGSAAKIARRTASSVGFSECVILATCAVTQGLSSALDRTMVKPRAASRWLDLFFWAWAPSGVIPEAYRELDVAPWLKAKIFSLNSVQKLYLPLARPPVAPYHYTS